MNDPWTFDWLFSEAGAGWIFGIVSLIGSLLGFWWMRRNRRRAKKVVCREIDRISLVKISQSAEEKIAITFEDKPVNRLAQLRVEIFNSGSEVVEDIDLTVAFQEDTKILNLSYESDPENLEAQVELIEDNRARMLIPFLNPVGQHKQRIVASIVCDGDIDGVIFVGGGVGWSIRSILSLTHQQRVRKIRIAGGGFALTSLMYLAYFVNLIAKWGVKPLGVERNPDFNPLSLWLPTLVFFLSIVGLQLWGSSRSAWPVSKDN